MAPDIALLKRHIADLRGRFSRLETALSATDQAQALARIRQLADDVATLQAQVDALNTWAKTVTPPGP